jgi:epoxyqueuosine reductase
MSQPENISAIANRKSTTANRKSVQANRKSTTANRKQASANTSEETSVVIHQKETREGSPSSPAAAVFDYWQERTGHHQAILTDKRLKAIKGRLKQLAGQIASRQQDLGMDADVKVFVDTAPLMEKPLAQRAGLGWQGKHTNLLSRTEGNWLFLGVILTAAVHEPDPGEGEHCGSCTACLEACPTQAFPAPFQLDARRCLSYLTIEHAGPWAKPLRIATGNRIYGCDDCLAVCPWNKFAQTAREIRLAPRPCLVSPSLGDLLVLDDAGFRALFSKSPIKRIGRNRFLRNVLYAVANSSDVRLIPPTLALLDDPSPLVRGSAVWALSRLMSASTFEALRQTWQEREVDEDVMAEWASSQE